MALAQAAVDRNAGSYIRRSGSSSRSFDDGNTPFVMATVISLPVRLSMMVMVSATLVAPLTRRSVSAYLERRVVVLAVRRVDSCLLSSIASACAISARVSAGSITAST